MQILVVAGFVVVMVLAPAQASGPWWALSAAALAYVAATYGLTRLTVSAGMRQLLGSGPSRPWLARATAAVAVATHVYLLAGLAALMAFGWGAVIDDTFGLGRIPLVGKALAMAPFLAALLAHWWAIGPLDQAMRMRLSQDRALLGRPVLPCWSRRQYLSFHVRHDLLFIALPAAAIVLLLDCLVLVEDAGWITGRPLATLGLIGCGGVFLVAPMLIVRVWRARPLAPGPLRSSLEATCRKLGLKYRDIMVWRTGGVVANAGVMGLAAPVRYILLSDALLASLDDEQVRAIFAHEAGHVVHRHIPYMILFILGVMALCFSVGGLAGQWLWGGEPPMAARACGVLAVVAALVLTFGPLSRRFERQADVFAAASAGTGEQDDPDRLGARGVDVFSGALLEVARLNAIPTGRRNFRHGSIRARVRYLADLLARGVGPGAVNRRIAPIKAAIWVLLALGAAAVAIAQHLTGAQV